MRNDRCSNYDADRRHFCELLPEWIQRFNTVLHAYVLMDNHYHLLVETPEPNVSRAGGIDYGSVSGAIRRLEKRAERQKPMRKLLHRALREIEND